MSKKILFIAPKFYHYHSEIIQSMKEQGFVVTYYPEMNYNVLFRISDKFFKKFNQYLKNKYINNILENIKKDMYDIVFVVRGGSLTPSSLEYMHKQLPKAKFVMYQWDSMEQSKYQSIIKYFDVLKTFDQNDSKKYNLEYLPLFYTKQYKNLALNKKNKENDLVFYGAYHSDRLEIIKYIDVLFKKNDLTFKYHLYITRLALFRLLITRKIKVSDINFFKTYSVGINEIIDTYSKSTAVLDIELSIQNGLTIRTFETLGANLKLLTTNQNIKKEEFYDSNQIIVINREKVVLDLEKFKNNQCKTDFDEFYIDNWLTSLLS